MGFYSLIMSKLEACLLFYHSFSFLELLLLIYLIFCCSCFSIEKRFNVSIEQTAEISNYTQGVLQNLLEESKRLENYAMQADEIQMKSIAEFQKAYEV